MKYKDLGIDNKICAHLWRGVHIQSTGMVTPCCIANPGDEYKLNSMRIENDNLHKTRTQEIWNNTREKLIAGETPAICDVCWQAEKSGNKSYRQHANEECADKLETIDFIEDGTLDSDKIWMWDIRDTNLCNMKCSMCWPGASSLYQKEAIDNFEKNDEYPVWPAQDRNGEYTTVIRALPQTDMSEIVQSRIDADTKIMYWAGGEPLISKLHFDTLKYLIENNRKDIKLMYNTNMLKVNQFGINIVDMWKNFKHVSIGASIDSIGKRAEYARTGTIWHKIEDNVNYLFDEFDKKDTEVIFTLNSTMTLYTISGLVELLKWAKSYNGKIRMIRLNEVHGSQFENSFDLLSMSLRYNIVREVDSFIDDIDDIVIEGWEPIKNKLLVPTEAENARKIAAVKFLKAFDKVRNTDVMSACPELTEMFDEYK